MNEKEKNTKPRKNSTEAPKRTYRKRTAAPKEKTLKEKPVKEKAVKETAAKSEKTASAKPKSRTRQPKEVKKTPVRIIPLGGLNEIGKNMTVFECSNDMFILDCGLAFPDADMPGVDIVIPDFTYV